MRKRIVKAGMSAVLCITLLFGALFCLDNSKVQAASAGQIFAGYYEDEMLTIPASEKTPYSKQVDERILSIKFQMKKNWNSETVGNTLESVDLRIITTIDSLNYRSVGFVMKVGNKSVVRTSKKVYRTLVGYVDGEKKSYVPAMFCDDSRYFMVYEMRIPSEKFEDVISFTAQWTTMDGTVVSADNMNRMISVQDVLNGNKGDSSDGYTMIVNAANADFVGVDTTDTGNSEGIMRKNMPDETFGSVFEMQITKDGNGGLKGGFCIDKTFPVNGKLLFYVKNPMEEKRILNLYGVQSGQWCQLNSSDIELNPGWNQVTVNLECDTSIENGYTNYSSILGLLWTSSESVVGTWKLSSFYLLSEKDIVRDQQAAAETALLIEALPEADSIIDSSCLSAVEAARKSYIGLSAEAQSMIADGWGDKLIDCIVQLEQNAQTSTLEEWYDTALSASIVQSMTLLGEEYSAEVTEGIEKWYGSTAVLNVKKDGIWWYKAGFMFNSKLEGMGDTFFYIYNPTGDSVELNVFDDGNEIQDWNFTVTLLPEWNKVEIPAEKANQSTWRISGQLHPQDGKSVVGQWKITSIYRDVDIWSTYNTRKVIQQTNKNDSYEKLSAQLSVEMMRNVKENTQLIMTSDRNHTYMLSAGTLKNENGQIFPVEQITIYQQKYVQILQVFNGNPAFSAGDEIPDCLFPLERAVLYKENQISAGTNQGLTVEFDSEGVASGCYTGNFILSLDGVETLIPVTVEVWDISYEGRRSFQSSFLIYRDNFQKGEGKDTDAMVDAYVDVLMEYKANAMLIMSDFGVEEFIRQCKRQFADKNCSSLNIPAWFPLDYEVYDTEGNVTQNAKNAVSYIKAMAKISTEEKPYIEYGYIYPTCVDEADYFDYKIEPAWNLLREGGELDKTLELAVSQLDEEGWFDTLTPEFAERMKNAILNIPAIFTSSECNTDWLNGMHAVFCPLEDRFQDSTKLQQLLEAAKLHANEKLWTYTCIGPVYPYSTFHVDDQTLGMRVLGWMEKCYGITGHLYYSVNKYTNPEGEEVDVYRDPIRFGTCNGDGYLLYPGRPYGSEMPFGSLRLVSYREGMNDYDMLCVYENLLQEYAKRNGMQGLEFSGYVQDLYESLFTGMTYKEEDAFVYAARRELAKRILALQNGEEPICFASLK